MSSRAHTQIWAYTDLGQLIGPSPGLLAQRVLQPWVNHSVLDCKPGDFARGPGGTHRLDILNLEDLVMRELLHHPSQPRITAEAVLDLAGNRRVLQDVEGGHGWLHR